MTHEEQQPHTLEVLVTGLTFSLGLLYPRDIILTMIELPGDGSRGVIPLTQVNFLNKGDRIDLSHNRQALRKEVNWISLTMFSGGSLLIAKMGEREYWPSFSYGINATSIRHYYFPVYLMFSRFWLLLCCDRFLPSAIPVRTV